MNIYEKLSAITAELGTVAKNLQVATSKTQSYKAVSERDVLDAVKPMEKKYGVYSYPFSRETVESERLESESEYQGKVTKKTTFYTRIKTVYRFVNVEKPEEYVDTTVFSVGIDSQDKGDGKAMTYGDKYALMKAYKISTGDDPDQEASRDTDYKSKPNTDKLFEATANAMIQREGDQEYAICSKCGGYIYPAKKKDGSVISVKDLIIAGMRDHGQALCAKCYAHESKNR